MVHLVQLPILLSTNSQLSSQPNCVVQWSLEPLTVNEESHISRFTSTPKTPNRIPPSSFLQFPAAWTLFAHSNSSNGPVAQTRAYACTETLAYPGTRIFGLTLKNGYGNYSVRRFAADSELSRSTAIVRTDVSWPHHTRQCRDSMMTKS